MTPVFASDDSIRLAVLGDRTALMSLLQHFGPMVRDRFSSQIPKQWQSALDLDDLMQETYTDAFLCIGEFSPQGEGSFLNWLSTIARHNLLNALRNLKAEKRGGTRARVRIGSREDSCTSLCELLGVASSTPGRTLSRNEVHQNLLTSIERLPDKYRIAVQMMDLDGFSAHEVAEAIQRSPGAVYMLRARAHDTLKKMMGGSAGAPGANS